MNTNFENTRNSYLPDDLLTGVNVQQKFMSKVFTWMFAALLISSVAAYTFSHNEYLMSYLISNTGGMSILGKVLMFAPLILVLTMSFGYNKISSGMLTAMFILYSAVTGISLSFIFLIYSSSSIASCFAIAAGMFGVMAILGYTTKTDLTSFGRILTMALIGLVIASVVNFFMQSDSFGYILSYASVAIFTGLTAYDMQKLKNLAKGIDTNGEVISTSEVNKMAVYGALKLYLDFINIFLSLLRIMGGRK
jgi:uncharacterized protein